MAPDPQSPVTHPQPVGRSSPLTGSRKPKVDVLYFLVWNAFFGLTLLVMACGASVAFSMGCSSTPAPDPDHGVSSASYRQCLTRTDTNLKQLVAKIQALRDEDLKRPVVIGDLASGPRHSATWWEAELREATETLKLVEATLSGSNVQPTPAPTSTVMGSPEAGSSPSPAK